MPIDVKTPAESAERELRILYCIEEDWPTHRADVASLFSEYLPRYSVFSDLVTLESSDPSVFPKPWNGGRALLASAPFWKGFRGPIKFLHILHELVKAVASDYCAVQVRDMPLAAFVTVPIARWKGLPLVYWMSYAIPESQIALSRERGWRRGLHFLVPLVKGYLGKFVLYRLVLPHCEHIFVQSERMASDLVCLGVSRTRMTPVPMGVDLERADPAKIASSGDPSIDGKRVVLYLGTLHRSRRIELLIDMIVLVAKEVHDVTLVIVGDIDETSHRDWLKKYSVEHGAENLVLWMGWQPVEKAWGFLRRAEVGISPFPRSYELDSCSPTKIIEYLSFGVPVVGNDQPEQERVILESGAGLCVPWSPSSFADAVVELLCAPMLRKEMGERGMSYVAENRGYNLIADRLAQGYRRLFAR